MPAMPQPVQTTQAWLLQISGDLAPGGRGETVVRLDPPELGQVRITLSLSDAGQLVAVVGAERADAEAILRRHAADLSSALQDAGYDSVDLSFSSFADNTDGEQGKGKAFAVEGNDPQPDHSDRQTITSQGISAAGSSGLDLRI